MGDSPSFQLGPFLRALYLILTAAALTVFLAPLGCFFSLFDRSGQCTSFFQKVWVFCLLRVNGIQVRAEGVENLKEGCAFILLANHASLLDIPGIVAATSLPVRFIAKKSLAWFPIFGWFMLAAGHVLIERESTPSAMKSLKKASQLMKKGISVIVFPEGTRSSDGEVKDFKRGAFLLAIQSQAPIVPISISGTYEMLPRTGCCFRPGAILLKIGPPIATRGLPTREARRLTEKVRNIIINQKQSSFTA